MRKGREQRHRKSVRIRVLVRECGVFWKGGEVSRLEGDGWRRLKEWDAYRQIPVVIL